jgi:hypothetical protein
LKKNKLIIIAFSSTLIIAGVLSLWYLSKVKFEPEFTISNIKEVNKIFAQTPTGGIIELNKDEHSDSFYNESRFLNELFIICKDSDFEFEIITDNTVTIIDESKSTQIQNNVYKIKQLSYPAYKLKDKLIDISHVNWNDILLYPLKLKLQNTLKSNIFFFSVLLLIIIITLLKKHAYILFLIKSSLKALKTLIIQEKHKIIIPYIIALVPVTLFLLANNDYPAFIGISAIGIIMLSTIILFPLVFAIYYNKILKLNFRFYLSILILFLIYCLILYPQNYMYGIGFRDDISKFFVKAIQYNYAECLFQPNSGYLNVFQSSLACILLKVFSFKTYFPEALQISSALIISILFASFNLNIFRQLIHSDNARFSIVLLVAIFLIGIPSTTFVFEIPFLIALLLWPILFISHKLPKSKLHILLVIIIIMVLSKPIFIVYTPVFAVMFCYSVIKKNHNNITFSLTILLGILIQSLVYYMNPISISLTEINELGTYYESAFQVAELGFIETIFYSLFVFIRMSVSLIFPFFKDGLSQIIINSLFGLFWIIICFKFIRIYLSKKKTIYLFLITGLLLSFLSAFLFIKTVDISTFTINHSSTNTLQFYELLKFNFIVPYHRYLILGFIPQLAIIVFLTFKLISKFQPIIKHIIMFFLVLFLVTNRLNIISNYSQFDLTQLKYVKPSSSLWRENSELIFNYREEFYIPYYRYPKQSECIKLNVDRITDVKMDNSNSIVIGDLHPTAYKWEISQLITEYEKEYAAKIQYLIAITDNDTLKLTSANEICNRNRFIIFKLDEITPIRELIFIDSANNNIQLKNPIRLVGKYE